MSTSNKFRYTTPVGRLVGGSCYNPNTKNMDGALLTDRSGQPRVEYFIMVAFPKTDQTIAAIMPQIQAEAARLWPQIDLSTHPFSWKIIDGDGIDSKGQPYSNREGYGGCYIFKFSGGFAPKLFDQNNAELVQPDAIKTGYYVQVEVTVNSNGNNNKPGLFHNPNMIKLCGYGPEISHAPNAAAVFGNAPAALPAGASATPLAPANGMPAAPVAPVAAPVAPVAAPVAPVAAPVAPVAAPVAPVAAPHP
jgi:hypothetical protein